MSGESGNVVHINPVGEAKLPPLNDTQLDLICSGLLMPSQAASKSMAAELQARRQEQPREDGE